MALFHVWFATKRRKWLIQGDVLDAVREEIAAAGDQHGIRIIELEGIVDHVHLLLELNSPDELPKAMNLLKGASARRIFQRFPELKLDARTTSFWQAKYAFNQIRLQRDTKGGENAVRDYIRTQWDRLENYER